MRRFLFVFWFIVAIGVAYFYLFPEVEILNDHCTLCGRHRVYYHMNGDPIIYNLETYRQGDTSKLHQHVYVDPQITNIMRVPRWTLTATTSE